MNTEDFYAGERPEDAARRFAGTPPTDMSDAAIEERSREAWKDVAHYVTRRLEEANARIAALEAERDHAVEIAWGIIANAGGGNWNLETHEWREAAEKWRDEHVNKMWKSRGEKARLAAGKEEAE